MVNITIDFKNNKVYLRRPYIKGGLYKLSLDANDRLTRVIQPEVLQLLTKALESFSKFNTIYAESEYIQYDYNPRKQSGFLKLINNGNEIMHLSIFTGNNSTPHLTFNNIEGITIHIYLADLELKSFNDNISTTYPAILKKYNGLKDAKSTFTFFYDLLNLIKVKLPFIEHKSTIKQYHTQLVYYIDLFMNILANPGPKRIYTGKYPENTQTTLTNMTTDDEFTKILNHEINEKITSIEAFIENNTGRITAFNSLITEFIKENSVIDVITAIKTYNSYNSFPITDNTTNAFSYTEVFQNKANIDAFIAEFEKNKKFVESVELSPEVELSSETKSSFDAIVANIANINLLFNDKTHDNLTMILNVQGKKIQLTRNDANRLEKFMRRCLKTNNDLHNLLNKDNIVTNKINEIQALAKSKTEKPNAQTKPTTGVQTKPTTGGKTKPSPNAKNKLSPSAKTKPSPSAKKQTNSQMQKPNHPKCKNQTKTTNQKKNQFYYTQKKMIT